MPGMHCNQPMMCSASDGFDMYFPYSFIKNTDENLYYEYPKSLQALSHLRKCIIISAQWTSACRPISTPFRKASVSLDCTRQWENPVVPRFTKRKAGGHAGGWSLGRHLDCVNIAQH